MARPIAYMQVSTDMQPSTLPAVDRNPVLLVHGIMDTYHNLRHLSQYLRGLGWDVFDIDLVPNNGASRLEILAKQVADLVDRTFAPISRSICWGLVWEDS